MKKGYHKTKDGRKAKKGLYYNINKKKAEGRKPRKKELKEPLPTLLSNVQLKQLRGNNYAKSR